MLTGISTDLEYGYKSGIDSVCISKTYVRCVYKSRIVYVCKRDIVYVYKLRIHDVCV